MRLGILVLATSTVIALAAAPANAAPPTNLHAFSVTGTSVTLEWNAVKGAKTYDVLGGNRAYTNTIPNQVVSGLVPNTTYTFKVRANPSLGTSAPFTVKTTSDPGGGGGKVRWAGARSSSYGISPFPKPCGWDKADKELAGQFPGATAANVWIVGNIENNGITLQFPKPNDGRDYGTRIKFAKTDKHEPYLDYFDTHGIKVWLQVEPGFADMNTVIDLVLGRYRHHPSVIGFGVDVEWFNPRGENLNDQVTDTLAKQWETRVRSYDPQYTLFLKHFSPSSMPTTYRGGIVFVDDTQEFTNAPDFLGEMKGWADWFYPNPVSYQIGYPADKPWWNKESAPVTRSLGQKLATVTRQDLGVVWVDFTLRDVLPTTC
jgi:hypothetical protein